VYIRYTGIVIAYSQPAIESAHQRFTATIKTMQLLAMTTRKVQRFGPSTHVQHADDVDDGADIDDLGLTLVDDAEVDDDDAELDDDSAPMDDFRRLYGHVINGAEKLCIGGATLAVKSPFDQRVLCHVAVGGAADVAAAVDAASAAFEDGRWSDVPARQRARVLLKAAALLTERLPALAALESAQVYIYTYI